MSTITKPVVTQLPLPNNRMTLASIQRGKRQSPYRLVIHGVDGVGKTTFAADAPSPVFLGTENGTDHLDVARFPEPETWEDVLGAVRSLRADCGEFRTLVLDSVDWAEPLNHDFVCRAAKVLSIEDVGGGYGKGYVAALDQWRVLLADLERLQRDQGMNVVLIAHSALKLFKNPEGQDFDRYQIKLHDRAAALIREWADGVYFANYETFAVAGKDKRVRGVSSGARLLYTQRTAAYDAKDRYGLPESLPLSWRDFVGSVNPSPDDIKRLRAEIERKADVIGGDIAAWVTEFLKSEQPPTELAKVNNRLDAKLIESQGASE